MSCKPAYICLDVFYICDHRPVHFQTDVRISKLKVRWSEFNIEGDFQCTEFNYHFLFHDGFFGDLVTW